MNHKGVCRTAPNAEPLATKNMQQKQLFGGVVC